jgi:hypothetical protein
MAYRLEGSNLIGPRGDVVDRHAAIRLRGEPVVEQESVRDLRNALVTPIPRLEVQVGGPVVGKVVSRSTRRARGDLGNVRVGHGGVEGIAADDLVHVRRGDLARVNEGVEALDGDLRAPEA